MTAITVLAALLVLQAVALGSAKVLRAAPMQERAAHVGFSADDYRRIGVLELLAAAGLLVGVAVPALGVLAACGLLMLLGGALAAHARAGDGPADMAPALLVSALATSYIVLSVIAS